MADVLIYWRDYQANWVYQLAGDRAWYWHSSARCVAELRPGDRMWMVTSGKALRRDAEQAAFLVGVWRVHGVVGNPDDDFTYPADRYRNRVVAEASDSVMLSNPIPVDHILRPAGRDPAVSIGRFLQGPRRLSDEKVRQLQAAAGGDLAAAWLGSK